MASAGSKGLGQRLMEWPPLVAIYESRLWRRSPWFARLTGIPFDEELARLLTEAGLAGDERVLDLACGSGIYTRPLSRALPRGHVVGLDLSRPMLAQARRRSRDEGCDNLDLVRGSALALPFAAARFQAVNCCGALHLFPDVDRALAEIRRVLAPGGRLTAAVFREGPTEREARRARRRERAVGVHAFTPSELEGRLARAGFDGVRFPHQHGIWMLVAADVAAPTA